MKKWKWVLLILLALTLTSCDKDPIDPPITKKEVSIIFDTGTSEVQVDTLTGYSGDPVTEPSIPIREGYRFSHWELSGSEYAFTVFPNRSIVLNAVWSRLYKVMFEVGSDLEPINPLEKTKDEPLDDLPELSYKIDKDGKGYEFLYWQYEGVELPFTQMPEMDLLLVAKWEERNVISFDTGESTVSIEPIFANEGEEITAPNVVPTREGYIFTGWFYKGKPYIFDTMPNHSIRLEARYESLDSGLYSMSTLPKMFINLENNYPLEKVDRENYIKSSITIHGVTDEDMLVAISSEFRGRGHGSWTDSGPKKGYRLKFFSKQSLFGEAKSKHWVLLAGANFYDPTLAKNAAAFNMARNVFSNIEYTTSSHWLELYINGEYRGVYLLVEHVKVEKNRIDIESKYGVLDTGYLIEYDVYAPEDGPEGLAYFRVNGFKYPFAIKEPDPEDYLAEGITESEFRSQVQFIKNYTTTTLQAALNKDLNTFMQYADINSFIDMYLLHELFKNTDTGWSSFYMYKKPGGKLYAGAAWDFDASAGKNRGDTSPTGFFVADTVQQSSPHTASELYISLMKIPEFKALVASRWKQISSDAKAFINHFLSDEFIETHQFAFGRNYSHWSNKGPDYGNYPTLDYAMNQWGIDVKALRSWLITRSEWFDDVFQ